MRFQHALLLQKQQAREEERQREGQQALRRAAAFVDEHYALWSASRDPLGESYGRILEVQSRLAALASAPLEEDSHGDTEGHPLPGATSSDGRQQAVAEEVAVAAEDGEREEERGDDLAAIIVRHENAESHLNQTSFKLYRKLRFG